MYGKIVDISIDVNSTVDLTCVGRLLILVFCFCFCIILEISSLLSKNYPGSQCARVMDI